MISDKDIEHLAELARIEVRKEETASLAKDIETILGYVQQVQEISIENAAPEKTGPINIFREDINPHKSGAYTDALLSAAPKREGDYIKVKKIL